MATATYAHAAHPNQHLGGQPFSRPGDYGHGGGHGGAYAGHSEADEREYNRLRDLARAEHAKMQSCFDRASQAHSAHSGASAHTLSQEGHAHQASAASYNAQASQLILRANNAHSPPDTIDLHGQYVEEAAAILASRIREARAQGLDHLHVVVGKGIHSVDHVQRIKPRVEELCREEGLSFRTEANEGRIYVMLGGAGAGAGGYAPQEMGQPVYAPQQQGGYGYGQQQQQQQQQGQYGRPPQQLFEQEGQQGGQQGQQDLVATCLKVLKGCCSVM